MQRTFIEYKRCSTARQGVSGLGLDAQERAVAAYVASQGGRVIESFTEVETGRKNDRPQLQKAIALCKLTNSVLAIAKLDRLSRNAAFLLNLYESGLDFVACDMPNATRTIVGVMALIAQDEAEMISKRTIDALGSVKERIKHDGFYVSKAGNIITRLGNDDGLKNRTSEDGVRKLKEKADEFAQRVYPTIRDLKSAGLSYQAIADRLNEMTVRSSRKRSWHAMSVKRVYDRPAFQAA